MSIRMDVDDAFAVSLLTAPGAVDVLRIDARDVDPRMDGAALGRWAHVRVAEIESLTPLWGARAWFTGARPGLVLALLAGVLGLSGAGLAGRGTFDILTPPLLGLLLWQWAVFALLIVRRLRGDEVRAGALRLALGRFATFVARTLAGARALEDLGDGPAFVARWHDRAGSSVRARLASTLHLASAALALGAVAGLYLDGLSTAYGARWESTFLDAAQVTPLVHVLLGPASWLTGIALPDAAMLDGMRTTPAPAAPWIHLWAVTLGLLVVAPRLILAVTARARSRAQLDLEADPAVRQLLARLRGEAVTLTVLPLGYRPDVRGYERLSARIADVWGAHVVPDRRPPVPWDAEPSTMETSGREVVLMVNPAQTPEEEVHGPLLDALGADRVLTLALDVAAYGAGADRRTSRIAAWRRMAEAHGADTLVLEDTR